MVKVDINNPANYKPCRKKQYEIWCCLPPVGTVVVNKLEQPKSIEILKQLGIGGNHDSVSASKYKELVSQGKAAPIQQLINQGLAYGVADNSTFVLSGTVGELWTIKADKLAATYQFVNFDGTSVPINGASFAKRQNYDGSMYWKLVVAKPKQMNKTMACFVPSSQHDRIQTAWGAVLECNSAGVYHGKGDFVVCSVGRDGKPNLADRWVVNGAIFATTYNNQGWTDCLASQLQGNVDVKEPFDLFYVSPMDYWRNGRSDADVIKVLYDKSSYKENKKSIMNNGLTLQAETYAPHPNYYAPEAKITIDKDAIIYREEDLMANGFTKKFEKNDDGLKQAFFLFESLDGQNVSKRGRSKYPHEI